MATFQAQVEDYVGSISDTAALTQWLTDGAVDVLRRIEMINKPFLFHKFAANEEVSDGTGLDEEDYFRVIDVARDGYPASPAPSSVRHKLSSATSLMRATTQHPKYYNLNGKIYVKPDPTGSAKGEFSVIKFPAVAYDDESISNFAQEFEYLVVLYAAKMRVLSQMNSVSFPSDTSLPASPALGTLSDVSESLPTFTSVPNVALPNPPSDADIDFSGIGSTPSFTQPSVPILPVLEDIDDISISSLSLSSTPPVPPSVSLSDGEIDSFSTAPSFSPPVLTLSEREALEPLTLPVPPDLDSIDVSGVSAPTAPDAPSFSSADIVLGDAPVFVAPTPKIDISTALGTVTTYIETNEDIELASAKLQEVQTTVNEYQVDLQRALYKFNEQAEEYRAVLTEKTEEARLTQTIESSEYMAELQRYASQVEAYIAEINATVNTGNTINQSRINRYTADVSAKIQKWQLEELQAKQQKWIAERETDIAKYSADIQSALNSFNADNIEYQADIQKKIQEASNQLTSDREETMAKIQNYQAALTKYQTDVNAEVQEYVNKEVNATLQEWTTKRTMAVQEYNAQATAKINHYAAELQSNTQDYNADLENWRQLIAKAVQTYQAETGYDLSKYTQEVNSAIQEHQADLNNETSEFSSGIQKYTQDLATVTEKNNRTLNQFAQEIALSGARSQAILNQYTAENAQRQAELQKYTQIYSVLSAEYNRGFSMFVPQPEEEPKR